MDEIRLRLIDLEAMHPRLLWADIVSATSAVLVGPQSDTIYRIPVECVAVPGFGSAAVGLLLDADGVSTNRVDRVRRTYDPARLIELAAIGIAGLALRATGAHEIIDVAARGSSADYLVDEARHLLEVAGRSRESDFATAWDDRHKRLSDRQAGGFYLCVVEFESPIARLAFES